MPQPVRLADAVLAPPYKAHGNAQKLGGVQRVVDLLLPLRLAEQVLLILDRIDLEVLPDVLQAEPFLKRNVWHHLLLLRNTLSGPTQAVRRSPASPADLYDPI